jgi:N-glycosylase/DNA lyase
MQLRANGPFSLEHTLESGQAFRWRRENGWYWGVVAGIVFKVRETVEGVEFVSGPVSETEAAPVLFSYLRLDDDISAIYRELRRDARLAEAVDLYPGLRLVRQEPWECLVSFVISAFSNIPRITKHIEEISVNFGDPVALGDYRRHSFPSPAQLVEVGEAQYRELGLGFRSRYLARLPRTVLDLGFDLNELRRGSFQAVRATLLDLYGVGVKVADCVLTFSLDQLEAFPVDVWVRRAVQEWYFEDVRQTDRSVRLWAAEHFGPNAGYAQQYLFYQRRLEGRERRSTRSAATPQGSRPPRQAPRSRRR